MYHSYSFATTYATVTNGAVSSARARTRSASGAPMPGDSSFGVGGRTATGEARGKSAEVARDGAS